ncbi:MAG TPA: phospholipase [Paucimonas sp.]|nr:phospholipase [Paucimonas sp.]
MKAKLSAIALMFCVSASAHAWNTETHRRIVIDAVQFMKANPGITNYAKLQAGVTRAGYTIEQFAQALGQGAVDPDYFADTYICGSTTGFCESSPLWGALTIARYTSYWHFQNHGAGRDVHGNPFGGYDYSKNPVRGDIDNLAVTWLLNDYLDDGPGGMSGWFGDGTKYNTYGKTEANYRLGGYSTPAMYGDFQTMPFQPIDNLAQHFWQQFLAQPSAQTLGFVMHSTDLLQPHHTWSTSGMNHSGWEQWVDSYYYTEKLNDPALVKAALADFTPLSPTQVDIRPLLTQGGTYSYKYGSAVLYSTDHGDRVNVARKMVPHSIAMVVHILNRAAERL